MNRRGFLKRFGIGLGAALTLAALPASAVKALTLPEAGKRLAIEYMLRRYREMARGRRADTLPSRMRVSPGLFAAYMGELTVNERFCSGIFSEFAALPQGLMFKGLIVTADPSLKRWEDVQWVEPVREYRINKTGLTDEQIGAFQRAFKACTK